MKTDLTIGTQELRERLMLEHGHVDEDTVKRHAESRAALRGGRATSDGPCMTKVCRMGEKECSNYRSCRDTCMVSGERLTSMKHCPEADNG